MPSGKQRWTSERLEHFIAAWESSPTLMDAARALGISPRRASDSAGYLRRMGVELKRFSTSGIPADLFENGSMALAKYRKSTECDCGSPKAPSDECCTGCQEIEQHMAKRRKERQAHAEE